MRRRERDELLLELLLELLELELLEPLLLLKRMLGVAAENYPEEAAAVVVCNAPAFAAAAWRMIKPALNANTQKKVRITADGCRSDLTGYG